MIDSVIAGTGNSRYLRTSISADTTWEAALTMLRNGTFPIDLAGINQAGFSTLGTVLNADTLLKSAIITALDLDADATPSDAWEAVLALIGEKADADAVVTGLSYDGETKTLSATINGASVTVATFNFTTPQEAAEAAPVQSVAGKIGEVSLDAGDVEYNEETEYADGTVGSELSALKNAVSDTNSALSNKAGILRDSVTGAIASFVPDYTVENLLGLSVAFSPVQNLNGYDSPWPAGGGKNLLDPNYASGDSYSSGGLTFTKNADGSVNVSGTATENTNYYLKTSGAASGLKAGSYTFTYHFSGSSSGFACMIIGGSSSAITYQQVTETSPKTITLDTDNQTIGHCLIQVSSGNTINGTVYPMIRVSSEASNVWTPYSNLCPISGWSSLTVEQTGKNLTSQIDKTLSGAGYVFGTPSSDYINTDHLVLPAGDYTLSFELTGATAGAQGQLILWRSANKIVTKTFFIPDGTVTLQFTMTEPFDRWQFYANSASGGTFINFRLVTGTSTAPTYVPYNGRSISISLGSTVYSGTLDVLTGVVTSTYTYYKLSSVNPSRIAAYDIGGKRGVWINYVLNQTVTRIEGLCNMAVVVTDSSRSLPSYMWFGVNSGAVYWVGILDVLGLSSVDEFKTWLANNDVYIAFPSPTPQTIQLTPQEVAALQGTNNMWSDANGDLTVDFAADLKTYIDNKIAAAVAALS